MKRRAAADCQRHAIAHLLAEIECDRVPDRFPRCSSEEGVGTTIAVSRFQRFSKRPLQRDLLRCRRVDGGDDHTVRRAGRERAHHLDAAEVELLGDLLLSEPFDIVEPSCLHGDVGRHHRPRLCVRLRLFCGHRGPFPLALGVLRHGWSLQRDRVHPTIGQLPYINQRNSQCYSGHNSYSEGQCSFVFDNAQMNISYGCGALSSTSHMRRAGRSRRELGRKGRTGHAQNNKEVS